ncbi:MAG: iron-containing redox enzyme family protein [Flavobacteriales bacterium]|nr:iron-containing redox enzyme family protein [Flavobacteriales bacterium]
MNTLPVDQVDLDQQDNSLVMPKGPLTAFLKNWDDEYEKSVINIDLFNPGLVSQLSEFQKQYFVKVFYHSRGHFSDLLWYLGNFAPDKEAKDIILHNISEEFNGDYQSHEQLYLDYARSVGVDLKNEFLENTYYTREMYEFNRSHLEWASQHDWDHCFSAFSAYERLDAIDYTFLSSIQSEEHVFFKIHRKAKHFEKTCGVLERIWERNSQAVEKAFSFIAKKQAAMWIDLSDSVFSCEK